MEREMKKTIPILFAVSLVLGAGCDGDKETFSRYPSLDVPEYQTDDYIRELSGSNPEVVYNAICHLGKGAAGFGNAMWGKEADPESEKFQDAQHVYSSICAQLQSKDPQLVAVSLRFLQLFARGKDARSELIEPVCAVESSHPLVQFEQVALLNMLVDEPTQLPEPLLTRLLNSKSWVVSRSTYGLIGKLSNDSLRSELLARYRSESDESERLLLLEAYGNSSEPKVLEFLMEEMLSTEDVRIRQIAFVSLLNQIETPLVLTWMIEHAAKFGQKEQKSLFDAAYEMDGDDAGFDLMRELLVIGYAPEDEFLMEYIEMEYILTTAFSEELSEELDLSEEDIQESKAMCANMEKILQNSPVVAKRLNELREKEAEKRIQCQAVEVEFDPLVEEFMEKAKTILSEHAVPDEEQKKFLKPITSLNLMNIIPAQSP
jgi:hypothetical protein